MTSTPQTFTPPSWAVQSFLRFMDRNRKRRVECVPVRYHRALRQCYQNEYVRDAGGAIILTPRGEHATAWVVANWNPRPKATPK